MKITLYTLIALPLIIIVTIMFNKFPHYSFSPVKLLAISAMASVSLFSFISVHFYQQKEKKKLIENLWLLFLSSLLTYSVVDMVTGYLFILQISPVFIHDAFVHHKLKPNSYAKIKTADFEYIQKVNNVGMRGRDIEKEKKQTTYRILMQGDSFTMGNGVKDDETFSVLLEKSLHDKKIMINGKTIEVLNAGVGSYAPFLEWFQLTKYFGQFHPDLVVLNFDMSDLTQETAYRNRARHGRFEETISPAPLITAEGTRQWIDKHLYITRLLLFYVNRLQKDTEITIYNTVIKTNFQFLYHTLADDEVDRMGQWQNIFDSILKTKQYCQDHNIDFLLTVYPWGHQVNQNEWVPGRWNYIPKNAIISDKSIQTLEDFARKNNIEFLNTFPAFRSYNGNISLYYNHDPHWTPQGHKLMALQLEHYLKEKYAGAIEMRN